MRQLRAAIVDAALSIFCSFVLLTAAYARADEPPPRNFDIGPQALASALAEFARQSHEEILYSPEVVAQKLSGGVRGTMPPMAALKILLKDSKLPVSTTANGAILVGTLGSATPPSADDATKEGKKNSSDRFLVAQATPGQIQGDTSVEKASDQSSEKKKKEELQVVIVTGSRIPRGNNQQGAQPVQEYTREDLRKSGRTTIADFLSTVPDVSLNSVEGPLQRFAGRTTVQLHGLPTGSTLVLLDGQRVETSFAGFFDLSNIPAAAVERVEVTPVGSSAIYGSDALAGAVNIVLRKNVEGLQVDAKYGRAIGTDESDISAAWGKTWSQGALSLIVSHQGRSELLGTQRSVTSTIDIPAAISFFLADDCSPGNVYSLDGKPLPGLGGATQAGIPAGLTGKPTRQDFLATAGAVNHCNVYRNFTPIAPSNRWSALTSAHYQIGAAVDVFMEVLFAHEYQDNKFGPLIDGSFLTSFPPTTLSASNPYNPFGEDVGISFSNPGAATGYATGYKNYQAFIRPLLGARGALSEQWSYEATAFLSKDSDHNTGSLGISGTPVLQAALNSSDPATALNPFTTGAPGTPQLLKNLATAALQTDTVGRDRDQVVSGQVLLRGTVLHLPSGPLQAVFGAQYDREKLFFDSGFTTPLELERHIRSFFGEARVPLLADRQHQGSGDAVALTLAGRYDDYSDFGSKTTGQAGLEWRPTEVLLLRGAYATSFKAPQLQQLEGAISSVVVAGADPLRNNEPYLVTENFGPNPNLQPETGNSRVFGLVYGSNALPGFALSLDYFAVEIKNYIGSQADFVLIENPTLFPGAVIRGAPDKGFLVGPITQINSLAYNFGALNVSGIDFDLSYRERMDFGELTPSLAVTDTVRWRSALVPGSASIGYLNQATFNGPGFAPRWKGTVALSWKQGPYVASLNERYVGRYRDYQEYAPNTHDLGADWFCDVNFHYALGDVLGAGRSWLAGTDFEIGAVNLFDKLPRVSYNGSYDTTEADIRGRFVYAQISAKW